MANEPTSYFDLLVKMRKSEHAKGALRSLDIIDTKAGGLAGLIGGFAAASTIILQGLWAKPEMAWPSALIGLSLALLALAGILCATCLTIISHFDRRLFADSEGQEDEARLAGAAAIALEVYHRRVRRYRWGQQSLLAGIGFLLAGVVASGVAALLKM